MDGDALLDRVETATETERSRLGSEKVLIAATDATLEPDAVAGVLVSGFELGSERLETWAEEAADDELGPIMADAAERYAALAGELRDAWPDAREDVGLLDDLGHPTGTEAHAGAGLLGVALVLDRLLLQAINYHVNEADTTSADRVRAVRDGLADIRGEYATALAEREGVEAVVDGATGVVEAAYATYVSRLEDMGLDPKPIC